MSRHLGFYKKKREGDYGEDYAVAACLWDGPLTVSEIRGQLTGMMRWIGIMDHLYIKNQEDDQKITDHIAGTINLLAGRGWIVKDGDTYNLTETGRTEAEKIIRDYRRLKMWTDRLTDPKRVSRVTMWSHLVMAAVKLPAGILSGSVGLLNDAADTLADGLSSVMVWFGFRFGFERTANRILVGLMLLTGGYTLYEAVLRFIRPGGYAVTWPVYLAVILSAAVCGILYFYQRIVGLRTSNPVLITQSVDSRNHVITALGVTAGLVFARMGYPLPDRLVGLAVALIILKSAAELLVECIRSGDDENPDLSRYGVFFKDQVRALQRAALEGWMLKIVAESPGIPRERLLSEVTEHLDFSGNVTLRETGLNRHVPDPEEISTRIDALIEKQYLQNNSGLYLLRRGERRMRHIRKRAGS